MSEQEPKKGVGSGGSVVMVDKAASNRVHKPYRPNELREEPAPELNKRSKAPAVPSVTEELKTITVTDPTAPAERTDCDHTLSSEKRLPKKISPSGMRQGSPPEEIAMVFLETKEENLAAPQPIPAHIETVVSGIPGDDEIEKIDVKETAEKKPRRTDDDSLTNEITEMRTDEAVKDHSEWSDDEEAGGLPRSESRASRVSRAVRQLFCCGVAHLAPSEENIPARNFDGL